jgi:hypothetical protein
LFSEAASFTGATPAQPGCNLTRVHRDFHREFLLDPQRNNLRVETI